jgi:putative oxidoreductase
VSSSLAPLAWFLVRAAAGAMLAMHGWNKLDAGVDKHAAWLKSMDVPMPDVAAWASVAAELGGGALLAVGLLTRIAGLFVAGNMGAALYLAHRNDFGTIGTGPGGAVEYPILLFLVGLAGLMQGGGPISIDGMLRGSRDVGMGARPSPYGPR